MKLSEIAKVVGGEVLGDPHVEVRGANGLKDAGPADISFVADEKHLEAVQGSRAGAFLVADRMVLNRPAIRVANPTISFAKVLVLFHPPKEPIRRVDSRAVVGERPRFGKDVSVYPAATVGDDVEIGDRAVLLPGVVVGDGCRIGEDTILYPNVVLYPRTVLGRRVILHAGVSIGADGFGYAKDKDGRHQKVPHVGHVEIEDDVEIGANSCVDRATLGKTVIRRGTKLDNLVHIAHNCDIGENVLMMAQVGIAGSCTVGNHAILAGQVGVIDHIHIGDHAVLVPKSGVAYDIPPKQVYAGYYAIPHGQWKRYQNVLPQLPDLLRRIQALEEEIEMLRNTERGAKS